MPLSFSLADWSVVSTVALPILLDVAIKGTIVLLAAGLACVALRRGSAALRHLFWCLSLCVLLALPVLWAVLPVWRLPILPSGPPVASELAGVEGMQLRPPHWLELWYTRARAASPTAQPVAAFTTPLGPASATPAQSARLPASTWFVLIWLGGVGLFGLRALLGHAGAWWMTRRATPITDPDWNGLARRLAGPSGVARHVALRRGEQATMPMTTGLVRSAILLPAEADTWPAQRRRVVMLHELAHVRRGDCLTQAAAQLACTLYWFNPLAWLAARQLRIERERACDDAVLLAGATPSDYAGHLLEIARSFRSSRTGSIAAVAMARHSQMEGRLMAILDANHAPRKMTRKAQILALAAACGLALPLAAVEPFSAATQNIQGADPEAEAVAALKDLGATVKRNDDGKVVSVRLVNNPQVTDAELQHLKPLTSLKTLYLVGTGITNSGLANLKGLRSIERLYIANPQVGDEGFAHLRQLSNLKVLALRNTQVTDGALARLKNAANLEQLWLEGAAVSDVGLEHLKGLTSLKILMVTGKKVTDAGLKHLKQLTSLEIVGLENTNVTDAGLADLQQLPNLRSVRLIGTKVTDAGLQKFLEAATNLTYVALPEGATDKSIRKLTALNSLIGLELAATKVTDAGLTEFGKLTNLGYLYLSDTVITDAGLEHLKGLKNLKRLDLQGTKVTDAGLAHLKGLTSLNTLRLSGTKVTDAGLVNLKELTNLAGVYLDDTQITDAGLEHLKGLKKLKNLNLQGTKVSQEGVNQLKEALPNCKIQYDGGTV